MNSAPLASASALTPQSPFQAPLFVRDRYGSQASTSSLDTVSPRPIEDGAGENNPWAEVPSGKEVESVEEPELPPRDHGIKAWTVLAAAFIFEGLIWGFPLSYGIFEAHYSTHAPFSTSPSATTLLPLVGTTSTSLLYLLAPLTSHLTTTHPQHLRTLLFVGWPLCIASLLGASFAASPGALIAAQGCAYGLGAALCYMPLMAVLNDWFVARRGLAYGAVTCATGLTGAGLPFLAAHLLERHGHATTLRVFALALGAPTLPLLFLLVPRRPAHAAEADVRASRASSTPTPDAVLPPPPKPTSPSLALLRTPLFHLFSLTNTLHALPFFLPPIFLPSFAAEAPISLPPSTGALLLALLSLAQAAGQLAFGLLSDRASVPLLVLLCASPLGAAVAALALWGPARGLPALAGFAVVWGFFASGFVALWARMGTRLGGGARADGTREGDAKGDESVALTSLGMFSFQKGIGNVIAGPVSGVLLQTGSVAGGAYAGRYFGIVVFTGACMFASAAVAGGWYLLPRRIRGGDRRELAQEK